MTKPSLTLTLPFDTCVILRDVLDFAMDGLNDKKEFEQVQNIWTRLDDFILEYEKEKANEAKGSPGA